MAVNEKERDDITYEIVEHFGVIFVFPTGWKKELNLVAWNGGSPKYDIRDWDADHEHMSRGITLRSEEAEKLRDLLSDALKNKK